MPILLKLGPIAVGRDEAYVYPVISEEGPVILEARNDKEAVAAALRKWGKDGVQCDQRLSAAAKKAGFQVAELDPPLRLLKALLAIGLDHGEYLPMQTPALLGSLLQAALRFTAAEPWDVIEGGTPVRVRVSGSPARDYEAAVMGAQGEQYGVALYSPGGIEQLLRGVEAGDEPGLARLNALSLLLEDQPAWVADAVKDATGVSLVPQVMRIVRGKPAAATPQEVASLVAVLEALTDLADGGTGKGECNVGPRATARVASGGALEVVPSAAAKVGRNDPCPCGSGQKFKKCHGAAGGAKVPSGPQQSGWHDVDARLVEELEERLEKQEGRDWRQDAANPLYGQREAWAGLLLPWALYDRRREGGKSTAAAFLEERGANLSPTERAWLSAQVGARWDVWEVLSVRADEGLLEVMGLCSGVWATVRDVGASRALVFRDAVLGRIVRVEGEAEALFGGTHARPLPPAKAHDALERAKDREDPGALLAAWDEIVGEWALNAASEGAVKNTDGHDVVFVEDLYDVAQGKEAALKERLATLPGAHPSGERGRAWEIDFVRKGNPMHATWKATLLGSARLSGKKLVVSSNSVERADALAVQVETAAAGALGRKKRKTTPAPAFPGGEAVYLDAQPFDALAGNPEVALRFMLRAWLDEPSPALEGRTPRQAVEDDAGRALVHGLLKDMEHSHARARDESQPDPAILRRELGLDLIGGRSPHHALEVALGAGRKMSETLIDFVAAIMPGDPNADDLRQALEVGTRVWNAVVTAGEKRRPPMKEALAALERDGVRLEPEKLEALVARKQESFGPDRRQVGRWAVNRRGPDEHSVWMEAVVPPELAKQAARAGIAPPG